MEEVPPYFNKKNRIITRVTRLPLLPVTCKTSITTEHLYSHSTAAFVENLEITHSEPDIQQ